MNNKTIKLFVAILCTFLVASSCDKNSDAPDSLNKKNPGARSVHCNNGLNVNVRHSGIVEKFIYSGLKHVKGEVEVSNKNKEPKNFSTSYLMATINGESEIRAYKQTFASEPIDAGGIEVKSGHSEIIEIYWPTSLETGVKIEEFNAICRDT